jgi:hypothetical protein
MPTRFWAISTTASVAVCLGIGSGLAGRATPAPPLAVYVGTYTEEGNSQGIYRFTLDPESG